MSKVVATLKVRAFIWNACMMEMDKALVAISDVFWFQSAGESEVL